MPPNPNAGLQIFWVDMRQEQRKLKDEIARKSSGIRIECSVLCQKWSFGTEGTDQWTGVLMESQDAGRKDGHAGKVLSKSSMDQGPLLLGMTNA